MSDEKRTPTDDESGLGPDAGPDVPPNDGSDVDGDENGDGDGTTNAEGDQKAEAVTDPTGDHEPEPTADSGIEVDVDRDGVDADDVGARLPPREVDRVFSLLEAAVADDAIQGRQLERLLGVLERALASPAETDPETLAELVSLLEDAVVEPDDLDGVDVDGLLSVVEEAVAGTTAADEEGLEDVFSVLEAGFEDPSSLQPEDVEQFRAGVESAIADVADPSGGGVDALFPLLGVDDATAEDVEAAGDLPELARIARVATGMTRRATGYSMEAGVRTGTRMAFAVANSESPAELLTETRAITLDELQRAGVDIGDGRADWLEAHEDRLVGERPMTREALLERGQRLLTRSAEVGRQELFHPAFASMLDELAGDEARILRLLATEGTQASLDVRDRQLVPFDSRLVAANLTMLGSDAGCRRTDRTPAYLQNLDRLGLVAFSADPVADLKRYQVLEAQPHVEAAREAAKRPKTDYGSVHLTDLGVAFCEACLPVDVTEARPATRFRRADGEGSD